MEFGASSAFRGWVRVLGCRLITYWPARSIFISGAGPEFRRNARRASPVKVLGYSFGVRDRKVKSHDHHPLKAEDVPNSTITLNHPLTLGLTSNSSSCTNLPRTDHVTSMKAVFRL